MIIKNYYVENAVNYAVKWAMKRNDKYADFSNMGGDCTNYISQCIYEGTGIMNYSKLNGWYYNSLNSRSPSWTSVEYLYKFLTSNSSYGPYGYEIDINEIMLGDIVQLSDDNIRYTHTVIVTEIDNDVIYVCAHSQDVLNKELNKYKQKYRRYIHINGVRIKEEWLYI